MDPLHRLLQRQLKKHLGADFSPPPQWEGFLNAVSSAYREFEADRLLVESSLEISSKELSAANSELRSVFQALPDLVMRLDAQGTILASSRSSSSDQLGGIRAKLGDRIQDGLKPSVASRLSEALRRVVSEKSILSLEYAHGADPEELFCEVRLVPHLDSQIVAIIRNITARKRAEQELEKAHNDLLEVSRRAGMAEVATGVLHNVGNVLNSVNIATSCIQETLEDSKISVLMKLVGLVRDNAGDFGNFINAHPGGRQLPQFLEQLGIHLHREHSEMEKESRELRKHIEHISSIVAMQQDFARASVVRTNVKAEELMEDALQMNLSLLDHRNIELVKAYEPADAFPAEKHKVLQVLVNLIRNAIQSCEESGNASKRITLRVVASGGVMQLEVEDNGVGIPAENLNRIFNHGFTTKRDGHGFGLHSGALAATEMGGSLKVRSDGPRAVAPAFR